MRIRSLSKKQQFARNVDECERLIHELMVIFDSADRLSQLALLPYVERTAAKRVNGKSSLISIACRAFLQLRREGIDA